MYLRPDRGQFEHPYPLRGDLRELTFDSPTLAVNRAPSDDAIPVVADANYRP